MNNHDFVIKLKFDGAAAQKPINDVIGQLDKLKKTAAGAGSGLGKGGMIPPETGKSLKEFINQSGSARMSMTNLSYTLRDAPYLFQNLQMGVSAVGENLLMTVESMRSMKKEAGASFSTFQLLKGALTGPAGIGIALTAVMFIVQSATIIMGKIKRANKESGDSAADAAGGFDILTASVEDTKKAFDSMTTDQINVELDKLNKKLEESRKEQKKISAAPLQMGFGGSAAVSAGMSGMFAAKDVEAIEEQKTAVQKVADTIGLLKSKEEELRQEREKLKPLKTEEEIAAQNKVIKGHEIELDRLKNLGIEKDKDSRDDQKRREDARRFEEDKQKYAEAEIAHLNRLAVIKGEKTDEDVLKERQQVLEAELKIVKTVEREREIKLELLQIAEDLTVIQIDKAKKAEKEILDARIAAYGGAAAAAQKALQDFKKAEDEKTKKVEDEEKKRAAARMISYNELTQSISGILSMDAQASEQRIQNESNVQKKRLEEQRKEALSHAKTSKAKDKINEQYDDKLKKLEEETAAKSIEAKTKEFNFNKVKGAADATISTFSAAAKALEAGPVIGPILAASIKIIGAAYVAKILSQKPPAYADGGLVRLSNGEFFVPPKQAQQNIKMLNFMNSGGKVIGAGGPRDDAVLAKVPSGGYVVNAKATTMNENILTAMVRGYQSGGEIGSALNRDIKVETSQVVTDSPMTAEIKGLRDDINYLRRAVVGAVKDSRGGKLVIDKYTSAAITATAEYKLGKSKL